MTNLIADFFANAEDFHEMARLVTEGFGADAPRLIFLIKSDAKGRVAKAEWRGNPVIVKEIYAKDRPQAIARLVAEHVRLCGLFPHEDLHFVGYLATAPAQGLVILPFIPGPRLDEAMRAAPLQSWPEMLERAVAWLVRSMEGGRETGSFSPGYWIGRLKAEIAKAVLNPKDAALLAGVLQGLDRLAPGLQGGPVPRGPLHGDFSSQNMILDAANGALHVFDVQENWVGPIALDLSWLLGNLTAKALNDHPSIPLDRGLAADLRRAAMTAPGLDHPDNPGGFMDFMTGYRLGGVLLGKLDHVLGAAVRRAIQDWLDNVPGT